MRTKGFTYVELLIVVFIILAIAAIAIPNLMRSRIAANEASAASALRTLNTSEKTFELTYNSGFTDGLNRLGPSADGVPSIDHADLVDPVLAGRAPVGTNTSFLKDGYQFAYRPTGSFGSIKHYTITAAPQTPGTTGELWLLTDESHVVRANAASAATINDEPI